MLSLNKISLALALGVLSKYANATTFATFCDDGSCSVNCGEAVSVDNPGCLGESGRNSVNLSGVDFQDVSLVFSPDSACSCQNHCVSGLLNPEIPGVNDGPGCIVLDVAGFPANSFRFIGGTACGENNC